MELFIINWRSTIKNSDGTLDFDSGTCEPAFKTEKEAKSFLKSCVEEEYMQHGDEGEVSKTIDGDWGCVHANEDMYEYWVYGIYYE